jgi:hypothetical protein
MEEFNIQGKQTPSYKYCPGTFGYTLVLRKIKSKCDFGSELNTWKVKFPKG